MYENKNLTWGEGGLRHFPDIFGKRRPSHAGDPPPLPRTPTPPLHSSTVARVSNRQPGPGFRLMLWCGMGDFFQPNLKFTPMGS
jgi:hypothetical protein